MRIEFAKLNGAGNDFVLIEDFDRAIELDPQQVAWLCDRHFGIGADGVILVRPSNNTECAAYMHYINADGSLAQMCGNGVRCFAKFLVDRGFVSPDAQNQSEGTFVADTLSGPKPIRFTCDENRKLLQATVDMGCPILDPQAIPVATYVITTSQEGVSYPQALGVSSPWGTFDFTCVSMGNPHAICFLDDFTNLPDALFTTSADKSLKTLRVDAIGAYFEAHEIFPEHANIEFVTVDTSGISMRVFERGCGETLACGTGACACLVASCLTARSKRINKVFLRGGVLEISWKENNHIYMSGSASESFTGVVEL